MRKSPRICCFRQKKRVLKTFTERRSHSASDSDRSLAGCKAGVGSMWRDKVCAYVHHTCAHWVLPSVTEIKVHWMSCIPQFCPTSSNNLWQEKRIYHCSSEWQRNQTKNKELVAFRLFKCVDGCQNWCNPKWLIECHPSSLDFLLLTHQFCSLNNLLFHILLVGHWFFTIFHFGPDASQCGSTWCHLCDYGTSFQLGEPSKRGPEPGGILWFTWQEDLCVSSWRGHSKCWQPRGFVLPGQ